MKRQPQYILDNYFIQNGRPQYFYIDFTEEYPMATWLHEKPKEISWINVINWKYIGDVIICSKEKKINENPNPFIKKILQKINKDKVDNSITVVPFLKSHLQKSIRRQLQKQVIGTTFSLLKFNKNEFFRRVSIIMIEDTKLRKYYINYIWYLAALSKGYKLKQYQIDQILKFASDTALNYKTDEIEISGSENINNETLYKFIYEIEISKISKIQKDLLFSFLLRIGYGGRESDLKMVWDYSHTWFNRFKNGINVDDYDELNGKNINLIWALKNQLCKEEDFIFQAVDYMCFPKIMGDLIKDLKFEYKRNDLEMVIWDYSSGVNYRKGIIKTEKYDKMWEKVFPVLKKYQDNYLWMMVLEVNSY